MNEFYFHGERYVRAESRGTIQVVDSVPDFAASSAQEVEESLAWMDSKNPDMVHVRMIMDTEGGNDNWDYIPRETLVQSYATARFKPVNMNHVMEEVGSMVDLQKHDTVSSNNSIYGVITHASLGFPDGTVLTRKEIADLDLEDVPRPEEERLSLIAHASLYSFYFPETVSSILKEIESRDMHVSMERWIREYDYLVWEPAEASYSSVTRKDGSLVGIDKAWGSHTKVFGRPVYRRSISSIYGGVGTTRNPANEMSTFIPKVMSKAAACKNNAKLDVLMSRRRELHDAFAISNVNDQSSIIAKHRSVMREIASELGVDDGL